MDENPYCSPSEVGYRPPQRWFTLQRINWPKLFFATAGTATVCFGLVFVIGFVLQMVEWLLGESFLDQDPVAKLVFVILAIELLFVTSAILAVVASLGWVLSWLFRLTRQSV